MILWTCWLIDLEIWELKIHRGMIKCCRSIHWNSDQVSPNSSTGPISVPKGLGRSRPNKNLLFLFGPDPAGPESVWPINTSELGQNQPGPVKGTHQCWARTGLAHHWKTNRGGIILPPSSCMQNECSASRKKTQTTKKKGEEKCTWCRGGGALLVGLLRWRRCGGGRWRCRCSRTAAPSNNVTVSSGGERGSCSSLLLRFTPLLLLRFLFPLFWFRWCFFPRPDLVNIVFP